MTASSGQAQISAGGTPPSFSLSLAAAPPSVTLPPVDAEAYLAEDAQAAKDEPLRIGAPVDVRFTLGQSGEWTELADGGRIWRLRIVSRGATSLGVLYDRWFLPEGAQLFLYNDDRSHLIGAFTSFNNWVDRTNITQPVMGDAVTIEYYEPADARGMSELSISTIGHIYRDLYGSRFLDDYGDSGSCNNNVNCPEGADWQSQKRGVAMILEGGWRICSGSLINNARNDFTPYFLTANHCLGNLNSWVFMFNYESPGCPNQNGPTNQTVANATLRANYTASDFALLQLSSPVPLTYNPYFNGWNREDVAATNSVCIHHPAGDIKKISFDDHPPVSDRYLGSSGVANSHWKIVQWDDGTTEGGSSGSPLFDQNHRITGQLHGGYASCTSLTPDWYGKFAMSWDYGSSSATRLRDWLDPDNSGLLVLSGIDPNISGRVAGVVTDGNAQPLSSVRVAPVGGTAETFTNTAGEYFLGLQEGTFDIEFTKFGYQRVVEEDVEVEQGDTTWVNATLASVPFGVLAGTVVTQADAPIQGATVVVRNTPLDTLVTDEQGRFFAELPATSFVIHVELRINLTTPLIVETDTTLTIAAGDTTRAEIGLFIPLIEPTTPDAYGYRAYDRLDRDLPASYDWVELDPSLGFPGIEFTYPHHDTATFFPAPFPISFYGADSDTLTVNPNGWMLPGVHHDRGQQNRPIPYNGIDPPGIIAPFWADLRSGLGEQQFLWHDSTSGRWIFEFINQRLLSPSSYFHNWQVHVLDPAFHPTLTGDCEFLFIYGLMGYTSLCTIGLEAPSEQTGVQVLYNNTLNSASWPIENGAAIRFTTGRPAETGSVNGTLTLHPPAENIAAFVKMAGVDIPCDEDGDFQSSDVPACAASALLYLENYEQSRASHVRIAADSTTNLTLEAWRLDPPQGLSASQLDGAVTLRWQRPLSVQSQPNPQVRYNVCRNGEPVSEMLSDTTFTDEPQPNGETVSYTVIARYRYGRSPASDALDVEIDLAADNVGAALPDRFALRPNYPNPFNPSTAIAFDLPRAARVTLRIFDVTGREVETLVNRELSAGFHATSWNASTLPSGVYLAVMDAGDQRFVRKMMLLK